MTTVQELSVLHRRYADISHRFRAGWTFHQFLQSLGKTLLQRVEDQHSTEFQNLYTGLKEISQSLNASESEKIRHRLEAISSNPQTTSPSRPPRDPVRAMHPTDSAM